MQKWFFTRVVLPVLVLSMALPALVFSRQKQLPAFPGAEGYGAYTPGGRGGKVYIVTSLQDSGKGTFREACEADGPRIVVFNVSGIIDLKSPLVITKPYITIAGQTAPGDGICLKRRELNIFTHDVIVRYIRSRPGDISGAEMDAISVGKDAHDVIVDHCSANWSVDECLSPSGAIYNVTVQWCLIGQSLQKSVHQKGAHGFGSLVRGIGGITLHHNLWINNTARNPRLGDNYNEPPWPTIDVRNNVMYNWEQMCSGMTGGNVSANYVFNYLKPGPASSKRAPIILTETSKVKFFLEGNIVEGRPQFTRKPEAMFEAGVEKGLKLFEVVATPFKTAPVKTSSAQQAYNDVLVSVGASRPVRDSIDALLITQVRTNTGKMIDTQEEVGGWPNYRVVKLHVDQDGDGIPDAWEKAQGLNPANRADATALAKGGSGYTNIEVYINAL
ncbi:pectate lyase [Segetibacter sp. 3557_3]|uniref:pectate lyase family protein n=1 Tax=Segetibacter sp. 3557_3 TaxID=2547429 RepID=UPI001058E146|nr:pectate lyase [Segetibacter sp. 3557_3]TDH18422.1 pectate lyase [Segetibacter sp. 3557_3]